MVRAFRPAVEPTTRAALKPGRAAFVPAAAVPGSRALYRYSVVVAIATLVLIKAGAMVTSTGSGLAFSDWPLADGSWWPPSMTLSGLFEHGHRAIGALIGLLVLTLTIWIGVREPRGWLRKLAVLSLCLVVAQGLVGALGIKMKLPAVTSVTHGVLAQVILCLLVLIAFALSPAWQVRVAAPAGTVRTARRACVFALVLVFCQLLAGAILRHTNATGMLWMHVFNAMAVALAIVIAAMYCGTRFPRGFAGLGRAVLILLVAQLVLGFATLAVRRVKDPSNVEYLGRSLVATTHVVIGALLFLSAALLAYRAFRNLVPEPEVGRAPS